MNMERLELEYEKALDRCAQACAGGGGRIEDLSLNEFVDLREVCHADVARRYARLRLANIVQDARDNGRTWDQIAMVLGTSKQAARERFGS